MAENKKPKVYRGNNAVKVIEKKFGVELTPEYKRIVELEGYAVEPYKDDRGNWTTGVGQTGIYMDMTPVEAMEAKEKEVSEYIPNYASLPTNIRAEILQLHYRGDLGQSSKFRELFNAGQYKEASVELLNHSEYKTRSKKIGASYRDGVVKRLEEASSVFADYEGQQGMSREEQDLTQGQLERMFGETATAPTSISIPGREREFSQREQEPEATTSSMLPEQPPLLEETTESSVTPDEQPFSLRDALGMPEKQPLPPVNLKREIAPEPPEEPTTVQEAVVKQPEIKPLPYEPKEIQRIPADFGYRVKLEDIQTSPWLQSVRAMPGDVWDADKKELFRVYSEEPSDISTPEEETKLGAIQQLMYGFDRYGNTIEENVADYLQTIIPMSELTVPSEADPYADVFAKADSDTRRDMLAAERTRELIEEYGYETVLSEPTGLAVTGGIVGSLLSPTTLIPLGGSVKAGALLGAGLSAGYAASADLAERGEIRLAPTAGAAILGGVLGGGLAQLTKPSNVLPAALLLDKNNKVLNSSDMAGRLAKLQREGKATPKQVKATYDYYNVTKPIVEAEKKIAEQGAISRVVSPIVDKYLTGFTTALKKYSAQLATRVRRSEINTHLGITQALNKVSPFATSLASLSKPVADDIAYRIGLGQFDEARNLMSTTMRTQFDDTVAVLKDLEKELLKAGHTFEPIENYFPRLMKDLDGFYEELGVTLKGPIDKQIEKYAKFNGKTVASISEETRQDITDKVVRGFMVVPRKGGGATFVKAGPGKAGPWNQRTADELLKKQKELMKHYASPAEALQNYITKAISDIEKRKVLGIYKKKGTKDNGIVETSDGFLDVDSSLGILIDKARAKGDWSIKDEADIVEMLRGYFVGGNQAPNGVMRFLRTTGYAGTIANPISAITQLGDLGTSGAMYGFRNTISAMLGEKNIKLVDTGLKSLAEFEDPKRSGAFLEKLFKYSGFQAVDRLGKETTMNAALRKAQQQAQTKAGVAKLRESYGEVFGKEFDNFIGDLQRKEISENVKYYAMNELADLQPVFMSEVPRAFVENPNGRILYLLKTFTLKQYDVVRNRIIGEYRKGNKEQAIKQAAVLAAYLSLANAGTGMVKDFLLGRDVKPEQIPDRALWGLLGVYGANQYVSERYLSRGDLTGFGKNLLTPATPLIDETLKLGRDVAKT
jgi:GH24 family phage-related lysozyme (muramidase)